MAALATLLIAYVAWVLYQLAIDRHLHDVGCRTKAAGDIGAGFELRVQFDRREIAAQIGDSAELAIGDRMQRAVVVTHLQRADAELFDGALEPAGIDVFADAEGVVLHVE
jgi:hypothetical protein